MKFSFGLSLWFLFLADLEAVKEVHTLNEFDALLKKAEGRPVIIDYFSQSCGPCRAIAPIFRKISRDFAGKAYFRKVNVITNRQTAAEQRISSMPTFQFWLHEKLAHQFAGADENSLTQWTKTLVDTADKQDIVVTREALVAFYNKHDPAKASKQSIDLIIKKNERNFGTMIELLQKKYNDAPKSMPRRVYEKCARTGSTSSPKESTSSSKCDNDGKTSFKGGSGGTSSFKSGKGTCSSKGEDGSKPDLSKAALEDLRRALAAREDELEDERVQEEERKLAINPCTLTRDHTSGLVEKVVIVGGGPGGYTAALYAARASLCPLLIAPSIGGQLTSKGVDVENYPGLPMENGGRMVQTMKQQARKFYTEVRDDTVVDIDTSARPSGPFKILTKSGDRIRSHTVIIATGAESKWLEVEGEWEHRGHGVSSCAVCDGVLYKGKACAVVGGGDTAMEDALYLSRVCSSVTLLHRRGEFRASRVLRQRVLENANIEVRYHTEVAAFRGTSEERDGRVHNTLTHVVLRDTRTWSADTLEVDATFVAIGHNPNTQLFANTTAGNSSQLGLLMDETGYITLPGRGAATSMPGMFAAGDVTDRIYRQAITSAGSGAMAALDAERYLSEQPL